MNRAGKEQGRRQHDRIKSLLAEAAEDCGPMIRTE
jgi:hypothetical protein